MGLVRRYLLVQRKPSSAGAGMHTCTRTALPQTNLSLHALNLLRWLALQPHHTLKRYWQQLDEDVTVHNVQCYGGITAEVRGRTVGGQQGEQQVQRQLQGLQQCAHVTRRHSGLHVQRW